MEKEFAIEIPLERLAELARKWRVAELSLFGSVVNGEFREDSDVDVLVEFEADAPWSAWEFVHFQDELAELFGRPVDLVERDALTNPIVRRKIFQTRRIVYAA